MGVHNETLDGALKATKEGMVQERSSLVWCKDYGECGGTSRCARIPIEIEEVSHGPNGQTFGVWEFTVQLLRAHISLALHLASLHLLQRV